MRCHSAGFGDAAAQTIYSDTFSVFRLTQRFLRQPNIVQSVQKAEIMDLTKINNYQQSTLN
jgi:hypothetical protein